MLKTILKRIFYLVSLYCIFCILCSYNGYLRNRSIENQISYLNEILNEGYDDELQKVYPEGKLFSNAIFALSILEHSQKSDLDKTYATILDSCMKRILSEKALQTFNSSLPLSYGAFYNGWTGMVLNDYINSSLFDYSSIQGQVLKSYKTIDNRLTRFQKDSLTLAETYYGSYWPADNLVCINSCSSKMIRQEWYSKLYSAGKHSSGLFNHDSFNPKQIRGSSQALSLYLTSKARLIDTSTWDESNNLFHEHLIDKYLGISLVKEYEDGSNEMDIDSGPIVFGYGAVGTIMNVKTQANGVQSNPKHTWALLNLIAVPINLFGKKFYLFKQEPMLDIFMLWTSVSL